MNRSGKYLLLAVIIFFAQRISAQSVNVEVINLCPYGNSLRLITNFPGNYFQWQLNTGDGFKDINESKYYYGVQNDTLRLNNILSSWYGYQFRCLVDGAVKKTYLLKFSVHWAGSENDRWENPGNWSCGIIPDANTDVIVDIGKVKLNSDVSVRSLTVKNGSNVSLSPGSNLTVSYK